MNSFDGDTTEPGAAPEPEQFLLPVADGERITVMLAAFEGWNDAGEAASDSLRYLNRVWGGKKVASIDADEYYDFQFTRPTVRRTASGERKIKWPSTRIYKAIAPDSNVDVIFVQGIEPSYKWRAYTAELLVHAEALKVDYVVLVGALLADVPHSRPIPVSTSSDDTALRERLNLEASQYEGPVGIVGVLSEVSLLAGLPTVSLWAAVPHYVAQAPSPKAQLALLHRVEELLQVPLDTHELTEEAAAWERGVDELATEDPEIAAYVRQLEEAKDTADLPEASGESIAREFERYLKRRGRDKP
ncbi:MAG TPA: carboxylate--amine ligase [Arthrobacter bacterium]|jgi:predicted ATP-grasp superfamily ATP-dependent carboligase|nr:carboxylate--amine ligase [Arthrobacter sp.]HBH59644.1 carboxylate--amine ligase [Arthrobacter sp.]HCB56606.1 carboxylate--amine ligase [Arthrobacter sp.]HCC41566.1 carboxylate--amine ligase [Arthrobacter sp.]HCN21810.1 carboxylate--amine ligase [Arthrobacter sp.]